MKLHFVCNGNVFRSRLAAAYAKSYEVEGLEVTTSGMLAYKYEDQAEDWVSPWAMEIAKREGIEGFFDKKRTVTTKKVLDSQDVIVFMNEDIYKSAKAQFELNEGKVLVWKVKDRDEWRKSLKLTAAQRKRRTKKHIRRKVRELMKIITETGWVDVVSEENKFLGYSLPLRMANGKGLWRRGCHVVITTPSGGVMVQKRSRGIYFSPGLIDVTLGGSIDAGEGIVGATVREIFEETGIRVKKGQLRLLEVSKSAKWHRSKKVHSKLFVYTFHLMIDEEDPELVLQEGEVEWMKVLTPRQIKKLIKERRLKAFGRLNYKREFYRRVVAKAWGEE